MQQRPRGWLTNGVSLSSTMELESIVLLLRGQLFVQAVHLPLPRGFADRAARAAGKTSTPLKTGYVITGSIDATVFDHFSVIGQAAGGRE